MFLTRLMSYLIGYVTILVRGGDVEKFINMAVSRGIYLWDIIWVADDEVLVKVRLSAIKPLRHIGRRARCRFYFQEREGLPFVMAHLRRRKTLVAGALMFGVALYLLSSVVWFIEVRGNQTVATTEVISAAQRAGLTRGTLKYRLQVPVVEESIKEQLPAVSWVAVYPKGTRVVIEIAEKTLPDHQHAGPAHIVAAREGLIKELLVIVGRPLVQEGDTVLQGQVLISGEIFPPVLEENTPEMEEQQGLIITEEESSYVRAKGIVRARVWYDGYIEVPLLETGRQRTGHLAAQFCIKIQGKEIIVMGPRQISFASFESETVAKRTLQWRNISLPVELITMKHYELVDFRLERDRGQALALARKQVLADIKEQIPQDAIILEERLEEIKAARPESLVRVKAYVETLEDIGVVRPFKPEGGITTN
jgi:similar to stage IV sporulation protein